MWWKGKVNDQGLSQGDIVATVPFCKPVIPITGLKKETIKNSRMVWAPTSQLQHILANGIMSEAIVLSHSCDLDKVAFLLRLDLQMSALE